MESDTEEKLLAHGLLSAAARHDLIAVKNLLKNTSANVQDAETGLTPLHAAIAACEERNDEATTSNHTVGAGGAISADKEDVTAAIVQLLLENGAIWNDLDKDNQTPGCIAWNLGMKKVYQLIVDAGVRAELLLNRLEDLAGLQDEDEDEDEDQDNEDKDAVNENDKADAAVSNEASASNETTSANARTALGTNAAKLEQTGEPPEDYIDHWSSNNAFLRSSLRFTDKQLLDSSSNAVMMDWEDEIMRRHASKLLPKPGLRAMNIGHGMGIVDTAIQTHQPSEHHIVEAHPAVLEQMRKNGWFDKPGVVVHEGRWQDVLPKLVEQGLELDAIYYDTFAESYRDFKDLFSEQVIGLMEQGGRFGFYNGLGADRRVCYDVYTNVVEVDLMDVGLKVEWEELAVPEIEWEGVRRPYWNVDVYKLPTCTYL